MDKRDPGKKVSVPFKDVPISLSLEIVKYAWTIFLLAEI